MLVTLRRMGHPNASLNGDSRTYLRVIAASGELAGIADNPDLTSSLLNQDL